MKREGERVCRRLLNLARARILVGTHGHGTSLRLMHVTAIQGGNTGCRDVGRTIASKLRGRVLLDSTDDLFEWHVSHVGSEGRFHLGGHMI